LASYSKIIWFSGQLEESWVEKEGQHINARGPLRGSRAQEGRRALKERGIQEVHTLRVEEGIRLKIHAEVRRTPKGEKGRRAAEGRRDEGQQRVWGQWGSRGKEGRRAAEVGRAEREVGTQEVEEGIKRKVGHHKDKEEHQRSASERAKGCRK
jgi:hypothetical protein